MTGRLLELADDWRTRASNLSVDPRDKRRCAIGQSYRDCADELLSILDAEGDGGAPIYQVRIVGDESWSDVSRSQYDNLCGAGGIEWRVVFVHTHPSRPNGVSDADVEAACCKYYNAGLAESRLAAANALLRDALSRIRPMGEWLNSDVKAPLNAYAVICNKIDSHLQGSGDEA